jgi:hypothetical protein
MTKHGRYTPVGPIDGGKMLTDEDIDVLYWKMITEKPYYSLKYIASVFHKGKKTIANDRASIGINNIQRHELAYYANNTGERIKRKPGRPKIVDQRIVDEENRRIGLFVQQYINLMITRTSPNEAIEI